MLFEFSVANFRSIKERVSVSFAGNGLDDNVRYPAYFENGGKRILKAVGLFGGNATGKSNVVKAVSALQQTVIGTVNAVAGFKLPWIIPFAFDGTTAKGATSFAIRFSHQERVRLFGFPYLRTDRAGRVDHLPQEKENGRFRPRQ